MARCGAPRPDAAAAAAALSLCLAAEGNTVLTPGKVSWEEKDSLSLFFTDHAGTLIHTTSSESGL